MKTFGDRSPRRLAPAIPSRSLARLGPEGPADDAHDDAPAGYAEQTRGALAALVFVAPMLLAYEAGVAALGGATASRAAVDAWVGGAIAGAVGGPSWSASMVVAAALVGWALVDRRRRRFRPSWLPGMAAEAAALGAGLAGLGLLLEPLLGHAAMQLGPDSAIAPVVGYLGAGIFEEAAFRLALLPMIFVALRALRAPEVAATTMAVTGSSLAFALAHHVGEPIGGFSWPVFAFRWVAGAYFAWVFILRGFGVAVGAHAAYDLLVACLPWSIPDP